MIRECSIREDEILVGETLFGQAETKALERAEGDIFLIENPGGTPSNVRRHP